MSFVTEILSLMAYLFVLAIGLGILWVAVLFVIDRAVWADRAREMACIFPVADLPCPAP